MSGMEEAQKENELARREYNKENNNVTLSDNLGNVLAQLSKLQTEIETLKLQAEQQNEEASK